MGFVLYSRDPEDGEYWIMAMMIDRRFQRRGLGRATVRAAVEWMRQWHDCRRIYLGHRPQNDVAANLYESLGFRECGRSEAEVIRCLSL